MLCLRICPAALVYVNILMIQDILDDPEWGGVLTAEDERGLTPLFWSHVLPHREVKLNMNSRLALGTKAFTVADQSSREWPGRRGLTPQLWEQLLSYRMSSLTSPVSPGKRGRRAYATRRD